MYKIWQSESGYILNFDCPSIGAVYLSSVLQWCCPVDNSIGTSTHCIPWWHYDLCCGATRRTVWS